MKVYLIWDVCGYDYSRELMGILYLEENAKDYIRNNPTPGRRLSMYISEWELNDKSI